MKLPPAILISETNFHNAWARAVRHVLRDGMRLTIGDSSEPKPIRDACVLFELTGNAIKQIESHELHPQFPFRHIDQYCHGFTREYLSEYIKKPEPEQFAYLYFERLAMYEGLDQIRRLRECLALQKKVGITSNRDQAITWHPKIDLGNASPPCLQRVQIRYLGGNEDGVDVHLTWRSRDLYTAWQANIVAIIDMLNREVIRPNNCRIVRLIDYADSLHIYESDKEAEQVKPMPVSPQK